MKNVTQLLTLSLILFLGACSITEGRFSKKVQNKVVYINEALAQDMGRFSTDGKEFIPGDGEKVTLSKATDDNTATYEATITDNAGADITYVYTFTTTDGKTGTVTASINGEANGYTGNIWLTNIQ